MTLETRRRAGASFSIPAILAIICAIASFNVGAGLGLVLAVAAIVLGAIGVLLSLMPHVRGGIISMISIVAGLIGIIAAIFRFLR